MFDTSGDQIHPATPARLEQSRRDGKVAKSIELAGSVQLFGGLVVLFLLAGSVASWLLKWTRQTWIQQSESISMSNTDVISQMQNLMLLAAIVIAPILLLFLLLGVLAHWMQTGFVFAPQVAAPKLERISPARWFKNLFSVSTLGQPFVGLPKAVLGVGVAVWMGWIERGQFLKLAFLPIDQIAEQGFGLLLKISLVVAIVMLVVSLLDLALTRYSFSQSHRMTDQELRDELRMQNGDPQVRSRRQQLHQSMGSRNQID